MGIIKVDGVDERIYKDSLFKFISIIYQVGRSLIP